MPVNSDNFDLKNWKLTLPVDAKGSFSGTAVEVKNLIGYENNRYFYDAADGAMVFKAVAEGATTSGSKYARTELREMNGSDRAAWTAAEGGTMTATLKVDSVPTLKDGSTGRIVIGQIHGQNDELVRLYWQDGSVHFVNDQAGAKNTETSFDLTNSAGKTPDIALGEKFSYKIDAQGDTLKVEVYADNDVYTSVTKINSVWQSDTFYFKAGAYLGVNETQGSGTGQTSFYGLDFSHKAGGGLGGLGDADPTPTPGPVGTKPVATPPVVEAPPVVIVPDKPATPPVTHDGKTLSGTSASDVLSGTAGDDTFYGRAGHDRIVGNAGQDTLWGNAGNDTLVGGTGDDWLKGGDGKDTYVFDAHHGHDTIMEFRKGDALVFSDDLFASVQQAKAALYQTNEGVVLETGEDSSITFTGTTLSTIQQGTWILGDM